MQGKYSIDGGSIDGRPEAKRKKTGIATSLVAATLLSRTELACLDSSDSRDASSCSDSTASLDESVYSDSSASSDGSACSDSKIV
jgi:hypothetical protein